MPGGEIAPQSQSMSLDFANSDMPNANGVVDNVLGANVNGGLVQRGDRFVAVRGVIPLGQLPNEGSGSAAWTQAGGLSLGFELPTTGRKFVFSKAGGDPKLALGLRPQESVRWGLSLVWALVWLAVGLGVAIAVRSGTALGRLTRRAPLAVAVLGVLGFFLLPGPLNVLSYLAFIAGSVVVAWMNRNAAVSAS